MIDYLILAILAVVLILGIRSAVKHFQGQGGCCGGGGYKTKKKKLSGVTGRKIFKVDGMHCGSCKNRVEEIVNDMKGVAGRVDLKKGELTVFYAENVDDELLKSRIERVGCTVTEIGPFEKV